MKQAVDMYQKIGLISQPDGVKTADRRLIINYLYTLSFYIEDFNRSLNCIYNKDFFQSNLYGGNDKIYLIQYYRHHSYNVLNCLGMIKDGVERFNKIDVCKDLIDFKYKKATRNLITHIYQKMNKLNDITGILHGFNVIIDEEDIFLRDIKKPVFNLDLLLNEITMVTIDRDSDTLVHYNNKIKLDQMKLDVEKLGSQVSNITAYTKNAWHIEYYSEET